LKIIFYKESLWCCTFCIRGYWRFK